MKLSRAVTARFPAVFLLFFILLGGGHGALYADSSGSSLAALESLYPGLTGQVRGSLASAGPAIDEEAAVSDLRAWLASAAPAAAEDFLLILNPDKFVKGQGAFKKDYDKTENCALTIFLYLLSRGCTIPGDSITAALALANSNLFYLGDRETRKLIAEDAAAHFQLYRDIAAWQKTEGIPWSLASAPLVPKVFWADRCRYQMSEILETLKPGSGYKMTAETYREFADSPEVLRTLFRMVREEGLFSKSLTRTAELLEDFVHRNRKYRSTMENLVDFNRRRMFSDEDLSLAREEFSRGEYETFVCGKTRRWDEFRWLNYQWRLYGEKGFFQGDCGDTTVVQMGFYRAAGICPVSMQWVHPEHIAALTHNFPGYYHPLLKRWYSVQKPLFYGPGGRVMDTVGIYLYWTKPYWHNRLNADDFREEKPEGYPVYYTAFYQGELTDSAKLKNLLSMGIPEDVFTPLFFSNVTQKPGSLFTAATAPSVIPDLDRDLLPDGAEALFGTDPARPDTDSDGVSDFYEIERGFNPLSPSSVPGKEMPALDGFAGFENALPRTLTVTDAKGDGQKDDYFPDIASVSARVYRNSIYVSVSFRNEPDPWNRLLAHSILLTKKNREKEMYFIQKYGDAFTVSHKLSADSGDWVREAPLNGLEFSLGRDAEFIIPLDYAAGCDTVYISYRSGGQSLKEGTFASDTDTSAALRLPLKDSDFSWNFETIMKDAPVWQDPKGDVMPLPGMKDIRSVSVKTAGREMYVYLRFFDSTGDQPFGLHSFQLKGKESGTNYWVQWWEADSAGIWTWKDGEESVPLASADLTGFDACVLGDGIFFRLDTGMWSWEQAFYMTCHSGGYTGENKIENSADTIGKIRVSPGNTDPAEKPLAYFRPSASVDDSRNDMSAYAEYLDIAAFRAGTAGEFIVTDAAYYNDPAVVPFGIHSFHARDRETAENWWIQWVGFGWVNYYYWKDGQELAQRKTYTNRFDCLAADGRYVFIIPLRIFFEESAGAASAKTRNLELRYLTGGVDKKGSQVIEADTTDFLTLTAATAPRS